MKKIIITCDTCGTSIKRVLGLAEKAELIQRYARYHKGHKIKSKFVYEEN